MDPAFDNEQLEDDRLLEVVIAIADGRSVDWAEYTSTDRSLQGASLPALTPSLQRLEQLVRGHQQFVEQAPIDLWHERREPDPAVRDAGMASWGPLILRDKIGQGSFGEVYRAWDPNLAREVALKLLTGASSSRMATSAFEEGRRLARIRHPNVVTVHGAERIDGLVGIWMEYVQGRTLAQEVADGGPMSAVDAAAVALSVLHALQAVHAAGLLHRDVKAQNVMRDTAGRIVLGDFGTGVEIQEHANNSEPTVAGTPLYLAPEILEGQPASERSDVYSVGVLLFFLVTGRYPVVGRTLAEVKRAHQEDRRESLRSLRADLPTSFTRALETLVEPRPGQRCPTAAAAETTIASWLDATRAQPKKHKRLLAVSTAATILLAGIAGLALPSTRARILSSARAALLTGTPVARQIVDFPCTSQLSADGQWLACVEDNSHVRARGARPPAPIVIFNPHTGESRIIRAPGPGERFTSAKISPDGSSVAFVLHRYGSPAIPPKSPQRYDVRIIDASGAGERLLVELPSEITIAAVNEWTTLGGEIVLRLWKGTAQSAAMLSPNHGELIPLFEFSETINGFALSLDGRYLAHDISQSPGNPERDIRVCELATRACETVVKHPAFDFAVTWRLDGDLMFQSDRSGTMGLWRLPLNGMRPAGTPELVRDTGRGQMRPVGFGPDGLFLYTLTTSGTDVFRTDIGPDWATTEPIRLSPRAVDSNRSPAWSPDGGQLAYMSMRGPYADNGAMRLVIQTYPDGKEREFQYNVPSNMTRLAWSPDGRTLAMRTMVDGKFGVYLIDPGNGRVIKQLRAANPKERDVEDLISDIAWLDPGRIVFAGIDGISTFDTDTGNETRIWTTPESTTVMAMALSPDRARVAITQLEGDGPGARLSVATVDIQHRTVHEVFRVAPPEGVWVQAWSTDGTDILVTRWDRSLPFEQQRRTLWRVPANRGVTQAVALRIEGLDEVRVHPTGKQLALTAGTRIAELWMTTLR